MRLNHFNSLEPQGCEGMSFSSSTPWNLRGLPLPKSQPPVPSIEASFGNTLWVASLWFEFGWIWLYVCVCVCVFDTAVWNSQYLIFYLLLDSSAWAHVQKVSLLPPELFIDIWGNGMWSRWGFLSNGESASSQTWPEFQNWGLRRVQNSSAVKELGSPSVNKWGQTLRLHIHSPVTESNTFSFCHVYTRHHEARMVRHRSCHQRAQNLLSEDQ